MDKSSQTALQTALPMHEHSGTEPLMAALHQLASASGLKPWKLAGRTLLPVVQGGMGVGVSAGGLAGARHR